jgi:glucan phosphoethanolaminetransferase (alkaline phosphatase superfamily)
MNIGFISRIPWLGLVLLWLVYALLGWYLSAHHIAWLVGAFVAALALAIVSKSSPWLDHLLKFISQGLVAFLIISLIVSISVALAVTKPILLSLIVMPLFSTFLAELEMNFAGFSQTIKFLTLTIIAGLGLGLGEIIDIVILSSLRY